MDDVEVFYEGDLITRKEAKSIGLDRYFTGGPCKYGHVAERYVNSRRCCQCCKSNKPLNPKINGVDYGYKKGSKPWNTGVISGLYVGQVIESNHYGKFEITAIIDNLTVYHKFIKTEWVGKATAGKTRIGEVKDYRLPNICGVGYNTLGKMPLKRTNKKIWSAKTKWLDMLNRCYGKHTYLPTYEKCSVSEEWHDFANFWHWYDEVCDVDDKISFHLDKDLLVRGNTLYSKDTCCLVPRK